ncbi:unnamed protein product [Rotaria sordida]|uniref:DUF753 domain-containing protein n=1 Tax=Rotaria sordida TaxID=392033 RepID=A0A819K2B4_9BILA|nr:unnamed protein product [Rotaria sordida]
MNMNTFSDIFVENHRSSNLKFNSIKKRKHGLSSILADDTMHSLAAAGWCYECDSRNPSCQFNVDPVALAGHKTPCNGQCYIRVKGGVMSRGCSWEYGFMTKQVSYTPTFQQEAMWVFCDTSLCNENANVSP